MHRIIHFLIICFLSLSACVSPSILVTKELHLADTYCNNNDYSNAVKHYSNFLIGSAKLGKYRNYLIEAEVNRRLAYSYAVKGMYDSTAFHINEARNIDSINNNLIAIINDKRLLSMVYSWQGEYPKAINLLKKIVSQTKTYENGIQAEKIELRANVYLSIAKLRASVGDFTESMKFANDALVAFKEINSQQGITQSLIQIGWLQTESGDYKEANKNIGESIAIAHKLGLYSFEQYNILANVYEKTGDYENALRYRLQSLEQADSAGNIPQIIHSTLKVGDAYFTIGQPTKAKKYYLLAMQLNDEISHSNLTPTIDFRNGSVIEAFEAYSVNNLQYGKSLSLLKLGNMSINFPDSAMSYYMQALKIFEELDNKELQYKAKLSITKLLIKQNKFIEAKQLVTAIKDSINSPESQIEANFSLGNIYENQQILDSAIIHYKKAVSEIESLRSMFYVDEFRSTYFDDKVIIYDKLIQLLQLNGNTVEAWKYSENARARSFLDVMKNKNLIESKSVDSTLIKREQLLKIEIQHLLKQIQQENLENGTSRSATTFFSKQLQQKEDEYYDIVNLLKLEESKYISLITAQTISLTELQQKIPKNETVVDYWCGTDQLLIRVITSDTLICKVVPIGHDEIKRQVQLCRKAINRSESLGNAFLRKLYDILWRPIEENVAQNQTICIIAHQDLHYIPFAALCKEDYLIKKFNIRYSISASLYKSKEQYLSEESFAGIALLNSNGTQFNSLRYTNQEISSGAKYFRRHKLFFDDNLFEDTIKSNIANATTIHFATHGIYNQDQPLSSFLLLKPSTTEDGRLTVHEIFNLGLQSNLVMLSACQTGIGTLSNGDELISINRAFIYAGAKTVISTLWNIDDKSTPELMDLFYEYCNEGNSISEAMRKAQSYFSENIDSNPVSWAAFTIHN